MDTRFGLLHLFESPEGKTEKEYYAENIELVEFADQVGLDEVWMAEHHFSEYGAMPSTQVMGSFIAARTKRIRIGTGVVVLPFHNPVRLLAEEFAFLDVMSEGRLDFGVGRGYQPHEFKGYGIPFAEGRDRFGEAMTIIKQAWTEGRINFSGKHWQFDGISPRPPPASGSASADLRRVVQSGHHQVPGAEPPQSSFHRSSRPAGEARRVLQHPARGGRGRLEVSRRGTRVRLRRRRQGTRLSRL